jgi:MFS family permease
MGLIEAVAPRRLGSSFRWLLASSWTSNLGDGISIAAAPLLVAATTRDPFVVALAVLLQRLPWVLFGLFAGVVADRHDRRGIVITVQLLRASVLAALAVAVAFDAASVAVVLVVMFVLGSTEVFADTTSATLLPTIVDKNDLGLGNARISAGFVTINNLAGPTVGAALFTIDEVMPFAVQAGCMVASAFFAARMVLPPGLPRAEKTHVVREVAEGLRWLWHNAAVRTLTVTIVAFNITYGAAWAVLVLYAIERLGTGEVGFGLLTAATAAGGIVGTVSYDWLSSRVSLGNLMRAGLIIETLTHVSLALTTVPWVAFVILFVFGIHAFVWGTTARAVRQRVVPNELQGRVTSVYLLGVQGGIVAGSALGGVIAGAWGVTAPFWFAFIGSAVLVVVMWREFSHIAHDDSDDQGMRTTLPTA